MRIDDMLGMQDVVTKDNVVAGSATVGGLIGTIVGNPLAGAAIGAAVGSGVSALFPTYSSMQANNVMINPAKLEIKPYWLEYHTPTQDEIDRIDAYYLYYGVPTRRIETMDIPSYLYNDHAYVQGDIHLDGAQAATVPIDKQQKIRSIFLQGVHVLGS